MRLFLRDETPQLLAMFAQYIGNPRAQSLLLPSTGDPAVNNYLDGRDDLRRPERLVDIPGSGWGPPAGILKKKFPSVVTGTVGGDGSAKSASIDAFPNASTWWVTDPNHPDYGIWGLNTTHEDWVRMQQRDHAPITYGWYKRIARTLPTYAEVEAVRASTPDFAFGSGVWESYLDTHPSERPRVVQTQAPKARVFPPAYELSVIQGGTKIFVAKNTDESADPSDEFNPHPGRGIAGAGAWEREIGDKAPSSYGLPRPLVAFNEADGTVGPAKEEFESVRDAARMGDEGARAALDYLGVSYQ